MKTPIIEIYALLVCFITVAFASVWLSTGLYAVIGVGKPKITISGWAYEMHQSNQQFQKPVLGEPFLLGPPGAVEVNKPEPIEHLSDKEITEKRLASYMLELQSEVRKHKRELIKSLIAVFICLPLFFIHWRFVKPK
tara:strand:- start:202 stop:612 length:411 start_codon:yes stop_codon:yes gene_type:complete